LWSIGVGVFLYLLYLVVLFVTQTLFFSHQWYRDLTAERQRKMAGILTAASHHTIVAVGSAFCLLRNDSALFQYIILFEAGFDVSDSWNTARGGGLTGMHGVPLLLHHAVALILELVYLFTGIISWQVCAAFCVILLGSGAIDLLMVKIIPHTPVHNSAYLWILCLLQFLVFLAFRVAYFLYQGLSVIVYAWHSSGLPVVIALSLCMVLLTLYHALLGLGLWKSLKNGGKIHPLVSQL